MRRLISLFSIFTMLVIFSSANIYSQVQPPQNLTASLEGGINTPLAVKLTWESTNPANTVRHSVWRKSVNNTGTAHFELLAASIHGNVFLDKRITPNATYNYFVRAYANNTNYANSDTITYTVVPPPPPVPAIITGRLTDANTGEGIRGHIKLIPAQNFNHGAMAMSDSLGNFKIRTVPGNYFLFTSSPGYNFEYYENARNIQTATVIQLLAGDSLNFDVDLTAFVPPVTLTLSGSVKNAEGDGLNAMVNVYRIRNNTWHNFVGRAQTDANGNYTVNVKENDTVVVYAFAPGFVYFPEFYDNKSNINEADRLVISENLSGVNFVLEARPVYQNEISGTVSDSAGNPVRGFVTAFRKFDNTNSHPRRYSTHTDTLGVYSLSNMLPGEYYLFVKPESNFKPTYFRYDGAPAPTWRQADTVPLTENSVVQGINFTVRPRNNSGNGVVQGVVRAENNQFEGALVYITANSDEVVSYGVVSAEGKFYIDELEPGTYSISADLPGFNSSNSSFTVDYVNSPISSVNLILSPDGVTGTEDASNTVTSFELFQNYPNPFNPSTTIKFSIPEASKVSVKVYNLLGNEVADLVNENLPSGTHSINFNATGLSSGVYFYKIEAGTFNSTKKLTILK